MLGHNQHRPRAETVPEHVNPFLPQNGFVDNRREECCVFVLFCKIHAWSQQGLQGVSLPREWMRVGQHTEESS